MVNPKRKERIRVIFASTLSSILTTVITQPLQVIKINLQLTVKDKNTSRNKFILITVRDIFQKFGIRGFWRGHTTCQYLGIIHGITLFTVFSESSSLLNETRLRGHKNHINYISGFLAGTCSALLLSPIDIINTRRIYGETGDQYSSVYKGLKNIKQTAGYLSLYRGLLINWLHLSNIIGLKFLIYNALCNLIGHKDDTDDYGHNSRHNKVTSLVLCGAIAGLLSCAITFPCEVIKRQIYVSSIVKDNRTCCNIRSYTRTIYTNEGFLGFFKGLSPALIKSCLVTAICFGSYDVIAPLLDLFI